MSDIRIPAAVTSRPAIGWQIGLWAAQVLLFLFFGSSGLSKLFVTPENLVRMGVNYATDSARFWYE
jgi:hypothetical protein